MKNIAITILLLLVLPLNAWAVAAIVYDPTNYIQNGMTAKNSVTSLLNQARQIQYQADSLRYQIQNSRSVSGYQWREMANLLNQANQITQQGQSISYSMNNLESAFAKKYPNYTQQPQPINYQQAYTQWDQTTMATLQSSLQSIGLVANDLAHEEQVVASLKAQSKASNGQLSAMQVTNQISVETVQQLQTLKQITAAQSNAQTAYMAKQVSQETFEEQEIAEITSHLETNFPGYVDDPKYGMLPTY